MRTVTGRLGVATTPRGRRVGFQDWSITHTELDPLNEWSGFITQRNPLLLEDDAVNFLQFEADETGKVLYQGYGRLSRETPKAPQMAIEAVSNLDHFPDNERFADDPVAPTTIYSNGEIALEVTDASDGDAIAFRYRLRPLDPS